VRSITTVKKAKSKLQSDSPADKPVAHPANGILFLGGKIINL